MAETPTISQLKIDETAYNIRDANALRLDENDKLIIENENEEHLELSKNSIILRDENQNINFQAWKNGLHTIGDISGKNLYIGKGADNVTIYSNTTNRTGQILKVFDGTSDGAAIAIGGGGLTILGSGEAAQNLYSALGLPPGNESLHLGADTDVHIYSNCQTVANRKQLLFDATGNLTLPSGGYPKFGYGQQLRGYTTSIYLGHDDDSPASGDIQWRFAHSSGAIQYRTHNGSAWSSWQYPPISASTITSGTFDPARIPALAIGSKTSGTLGLDRGGTGETNANAAARALGMAKTKGDKISVGTIVVGGFLTASKKQVSVSIPLAYRIYGTTSANCSVTGKMRVRQNDKYLFGSTATNPANLSNFTITIGTNANGFINLDIVTTSEQTNAINNDSVGVTFTDLVITLA